LEASRHRTKPLIRYRVKCQGQYARWRNGLLVDCVSRHWHDSVPASVCPFECPFAEALLGGRVRVGDVAATREGESVCLGGTGMASRLESHGHSRGLRITCILMRQRRARKSRQSLGQFRRSRAGGGRPGRRGAGARRGPRARPRAAGRTAPHTVGTHARTTATQSIQIVDRRGVCVPTHSTKPAAVTCILLQLNRQCVPPDP
jgi:hypothetical protein